MFTKEQFDTAVAIAKRYTGKIDVQQIKAFVISNNEIRKLVRQIIDEPSYGKEIDEEKIAKEKSVSIADMRMSVAIAEGLIMGLLIGEIIHEKGEN